MTEVAVSFAGNLTDDPEVCYTDGGIARAMLRVAVSGRREQAVSFYTVIVWRDRPSTRPSPCPRSAGSWSWADSSSGHGRLRTAAPDPSSRWWPRSWGRACAGRRQPRPGRRAARASSDASSARRISRSRGRGTLGVAIDQVRTSRWAAPLA
jgi:hypothetical protein